MVERSVLAPVVALVLLVAMASLALALAPAFARRRSRPAGRRRPNGEAIPRAGAGQAPFPPDVTVFVGRTEELAILGALAAPAGSGPRLGTICGGPGIGKTALVVRFAHEHRAEYPDGWAYFDLGGSGPHQLGPAEVLARLVRATSGSQVGAARSVQALQARLRALVGDKRMLLVLDDAADPEQVRQVRQLLPACPGCVLLVTSREVLDVRTDQREPTVGLHLGPLPEPDALALLATFTGRRRVAGQATAAKRVVRECEHLPMALHVVGARLRGRPGAALPALADALRRERAEYVARGGEPAHAWTGIAYSHSHLDQGEAQLFRRLALLPGPDFTPSVAAALVMAAVPETERVLDRLAAAHLLEGGGRYRLHDLVRRFALDRLEVHDAPEVRRAARRRALTAYLEQARLASDVIGSLRPGAEESARPVERTPAQQAAALDWFERERLNLVAAVGLAAEVGEQHVAWRLAAVMAPFLDIRGYVDDWVCLGEAATQAAHAARDPYADAVVLHDLGDAYRRAGDSAAASTCLSESLRGFSALDCPQDEARVLVTLGLLHQENHRLVAAVDHFRRALAIFRAYGLRRDEIEVFTALGVVRRLQGRLEEAVVFLDEALLLVSSTGSGRLVDDRTAAVAAENLGMVCLAQGQPRLALRHYTASLTTFREIGDRRAEAYVLHGLGECAQRQGESARARSYFEQSLELMTLLDDRHGCGQVWGSLGGLAAAGGDREQATAAYEQSVAAFQSAGETRDEGVARLALGQMRLEAGDVERARAELSRTEHLLGESGAPEVKEARRLLEELTFAEEDVAADPDAAGDA